jgi:hypothetical protein
MADGLVAYRMGDPLPACCFDNVTWCNSIPVAGECLVAQDRAALKHRHPPKCCAEHPDWCQSTNNELVPQFKENAEELDRRLAQEQQTPANETALRKISSSGRSALTRGGLSGTRRLQAFPSATELAQRAEAAARLADSVQGLIGAFTVAGLAFAALPLVGVARVAEAVLIPTAFFGARTLAASGAEGVVFVGDTEIPSPAVSALATAALVLPPLVLGLASRGTGFKVSGWKVRPGAERSGKEDVAARAALLRSVPQDDRPSEYPDLLAIPEAADTVWPWTVLVAFAAGFASASPPEAPNAHPSWLN